jgi:TetR/AcrR family fatty acid metabolism transcriptional regulator
LHARILPDYSASALTDRSIRPEKKRRRILEAAVRVFARKGFHASRVGDIAEEAGVAHGLLYHYFDSKDELLETIFHDTWSELLAAMRDVEESGAPAREQLRGVAAILLRSWRRDPDLVRVLVREVARSPHLQERLAEVGEAFAAIQRMIERGQADGDFRADLDARLASFVFYGALEETLTGWVLGQLPDDDDQVALAETTIVDVVCGGFAGVPAGAAV